MPPTFADLMFRLPPAYVVRTGWPALAAIGAGFLVFIGATAASALGLSVMLRLLDLRLTNLDPADADPAQIRVLVLGLLIQQAAMILLVLSFADRFGSRAAEMLALDRYPKRRSIYIGAFLMMAAVLVSLDGVSYAIGPSNVVNDLKPFAKMITSDSWWLTLLAVGVGAPLSEELLFRGFLFAALARSRLGAVGAAIVTTAAWASLHGNYSPFGVFEVAVIGLFLCWLLWRTGSLWVPIFCHALYNSVLTGLLSVLQLPAT